MKQINTYINEKLRLSAKHQYTCQPKSKKELQRIIQQRIENEGYECDLNDIDTSKITDMYNLFDAGDNKIFKDFNGDISQWDVSNVKATGFMFFLCEKFNCDISGWNVSNVNDMGHMFYECEQFNCDLSSWNVSNVEYMTNMFNGCEKFNYDLSKWDVRNVKDMNRMFYGCEKFNHDLDSWDVSNVIDMGWAFYKCPTTPTWYDKDKWE